MWVRGGQKGRERGGESHTDSTLSVEPNVGLSLTTLRSWPEPKPKVRHSTNWPQPSSCPEAGILTNMQPSDNWQCIFFFFNFYLFMIVTERERERGRDTGRGRSRLHAPGARCGIRSRVSRIAPWAKGRRQTAAPPRDPWQCISKVDS